jgi:heat shock protein HslJ
MDRPISKPRPAALAALTAVSVAAALVLAACSTSTGGSAKPTSSPVGSPSGAGSSATTTTLETTSWQLTGYVGPEGNLVPVPGAVSATATFDAGRVSGNGGCNDYSASYTIDGDKLTIGQVAATMKACGPAESALETAYFAALGKVATYAIQGQSLELKTSEGKVGLRFDVAKTVSLSGTPWVATGVNNGTGGVGNVVTGTTLTAIFGPQGTVAGSGGCNDYNGPYTNDATAIKIGPLAATKKLCATPAGVDDQEAQYFAALQKATRYTITGSRLELRDDGGALQVSFVAKLGSS